MDREKFQVIRRQFPIGMEWVDSSRPPSLARSILMHPEMWKLFLKASIEESNKNNTERNNVTNTTNLTMLRGDATKLNGFDVNNIKRLSFGRRIEVDVEIAGYDGDYRHTLVKHLNENWFGGGAMGALKQDGVLYMIARSVGTLYGTDTEEALADRLTDVPTEHTGCTVALKFRVIEDI